MKYAEVGFVFVVAAAGAVFGQHINDVIIRPPTAKYDLDVPRYVPKRSKETTKSLLVNNAMPSITRESLQAKNKDKTLSLKIKGKNALSRKPSHLIWFSGGKQSSQPTPKGTSNNFEGTYLWTIALFGAATNISIVISAVFSSRKQNSLQVIISTLAVMDLYICIIYIPSYTYFIMGNKPTQIISGVSRVSIDMSSPCFVINILFNLASSISLSLITLMALYLQCYTYSKSLAMSLFNRSHTAIWICGLCIGNILIITPIYWGSSVKSIYSSANICLENKDKLHRRISDTQHAYYMLVITLHLTQILLLITCFMTVHCAILKSKSKSNRDKLAGQDAQLCYTRALRTTSLFFISVVTLCCPYYVANAVDPDHNILLIKIHQVSLNLFVTKSAINPVLYLYGVRALRLSVKMMCLCRCRGAPPVLGGVDTFPSTTIDSKNQSGKINSAINKENV